MPATSKNTGKSGKSGQTKSQKAGLLFPIARIEKELRANGNRRISEEAKIIPGAMLEFMSDLTLSAAIKEVDRKKKQRIMPEHIQLAIRDNKDLNNLFKGVSVSHTKMQGWIMDNNTPSNKKSKKNKKKPRAEASTPPSSPKKAAKAPGAPKKAKKAKE